MRTLFTHAHLVVDGNKEYLDGALLVNEEYIEEVFPHSNNIKSDLCEYKEINLEGKIVMPGFFDTHSHGVAGVSFNHASKEDLYKASLEYAKRGTTSFFTTLTNDENVFNELNILENIEDTNSRFLGIHLEGPFISKKSLGMLKADYVLEPNEEYLNKLVSNSTHLKQMTIAPELEGIKSIINILNENNIKVMLGHSKALASDTKDINYQGFTHLFNGMSGFTHRNLGLVNEAFLDKDKYTEIIADGVHVEKGVLKIVLRNIRRDRLMIISDSLSFAGTEDGTNIFEGEKCIKKGIEVRREKDGVLAGGACFMKDGVKNMYELGASLTDLLLMSSLNAYRFYGLDKRYGSLVKGKHSDIVILDEEMNVVSTYMKGQLINA